MNIFGGLIFVALGLMFLGLAITYAINGFMDWRRKKRGDL